MTQPACLYCHVVLPPPNRGQKRKWCSDRCSNRARRLATAIPAGQPLSAWEVEGFEARCRELAKRGRDYGDRDAAYCAVASEYGKCVRTVYRMVKAAKEQA